MVKSRHNLPTSDNSRKRVPIGHSLSSYYDIRLNSVMLEPPDLLTHPTETSLHLVRDDQTSVLSSQVRQSLKKPLWQWDHTSDTHGRLCPYTCYLVIAGGCDSVLGVPDNAID